MMRLPPRRILVAADFSRSSLPAVAAARLLAGHFHAPLEAVYCEAPVASELYDGPLPEDPEILRRTALRLGQTVTKELLLHAVHGEPAPSIARVARARKADLIVVGTHGRRGVMRAVLGSVAEDLVRQAPAPVLVVRRRMRLPERILAPLGADAEAAQGLMAAALLARSLRARLDVVHAAPSGGDAERLMSARLNALPAALRRDARVTGQIVSGKPVEAILKATRGRDLLVLLTRPKSLLGDLVLGTTAERVVRYCPIPVLALSPRRRPVKGGGGDGRT